MNKLFSFLSLLILGFIVFAFLPSDVTKINGVDDPGYEAAKHKFYDAYIQYKSNLEKGIKTSPPIDAAGYFRVDENGNMNLINHQMVNSSVFDPKLSTDAVNTYVFTQSTETYTSINTTGTMVPGSTNCDDGTFGTFPIGFTFTYNGTAQTVFGVCCNGFLGFGAAPTGTYTPLSTNTNMIAPFAYDLQGAATGSIYYQTTGSAPNRICTIEWYQWGFWPTSGAELSFQIKLFETTNAVKILYTTGTHTSTNSLQVGINGSPNTDFANRTTTTNWTTTTAGGSNAATCSFSPTIYPPAGLAFTWAPPSPPPTPTLIRPVYGAVGRPQNDTLQWTPSAGATNYNMQIATDTTFATLLYSDTTLTGTQYIVGTFAPLTTYWWRVRAKNAIGWSSFTPGWKFKIMGPATVPVLSTPLNNATNQPLSLTCVWFKAVDQTIKPNGQTKLHIINNGEHDNTLTISNYWFEIYYDTTAVAVLKDSTLTDTTRALTGLLNNQNYWWRAKGKNNVGWGPFSGYFKFTTIVAAPSAPTNIFPANNSTGISLLTLIDWSAVSGATSYKLQVSTDSTFATTQLDSVTSVDSLRIPAGRLLNNTRYYWHVRAQNVGGNSVYSPLWSFTTIIAAPSAPTNIYPANNATNIITTTLIDWSAVSGATSYKLQVSTDSTFATTQLDSTTSVDSLRVPNGRLLNNVRYYWHVRAQNVGGNSSYSPTWNFLTSTTGITNNGNVIPKVFKLYQSYPNPFNPSTMIKFDIPNSGFVKMEIYNSIGQLVKTLVNGNFEAGSYSVSWDASNFSSGIYFYRITSGNFVGVEKMLLLK